MVGADRGCFKGRHGLDILTCPLGCLRECVPQEHPLGCQDCRNAETCKQGRHDSEVGNQREH